MPTDIERLENEFAAAKSPALSARVLAPRILVALMCAYEAFEAFQRGQYMFDVVFAVILTWMALEYDQSRRRDRLYSLAAEIIAYYQKRAAK